MITNYKQNNDIVSPFVKKQAYDISGNETVQEEVRKNLGEYHFTATFEQDVETLKALQPISSAVIGYICKLKLNGQVISFGRGMSVITHLNKYMERNISFAFNAALIDAVVRGVKVLDVMHTNINQEQNTDTMSNETYETKKTQNFIPITEKQKNFLLRLLKSNHASENEYSLVDGLSKNEAREKINLLASR